MPYVDHGRCTNEGRDKKKNVKEFPAKDARVSPKQYAQAVTEREEIAVLQNQGRCAGS